MIQANELRIGNWVYENSKPKKVHSVSNINAKNYSKISPIPLTPEILEKCGFFKFNNAWVLKSFIETDYLKWHFSIWNQHDGIYTYNSAEFCPELTSVHQLQNLYFALTGEELKINL